MLEAIKNPAVRANSRDIIGEKITALERALLGVHYLGEMSPKAFDLIQTFGKRLSAVIVVVFLNDAGEKSIPVEAHEAGLFTDGCFERARALEKYQK